MTSAFAPELWRRHLWFWLAPLLLVVLNLALIGIYAGVYAGRVDQLEVALVEERSRLSQLQERRSEVAERLTLAEDTRSQVVRLYREVFATERERLTRIIREVKELAQSSGFEVTNISYPEEQFEDYDLVRMSFAFSVDGSYADLRRFINALELSESYITLQEIRVGEREQGLAVALRLSTLFAEPDADPLAPVARARRPRS